MRIALYEPVGPTSASYPFGDTRVPELLALALDRSGHKVDRVAATAAGARAQPGEVLADEHEIEQILAGFASSAQPRPDVWISLRIDDESGGRVGRAVSTALGIPHILVQPRVDRSGTASPGKPTIPLQAIAEADATLVLSSADVSAISEQLPSHANRIVALPPFVDFNAALQMVRHRRANRAAQAVRLMLAADVPWVIAAGPMATDRDIESYWALVQAMTPFVTMKWHLIVVGAGPRHADVRKLLARIPAPNHRLVTIDSPLALLTFLASGDLFVAPSADESLPLAAIEAQAMGVPVVAARSPDAQNVVSDGKTGTLSKPGNIASLASGITFLLRHPNFRRTYAENGPGWVAKNFDVNAVASQLDATLHRVVRLVNPNEAARPVRPVD